MLKGAASSFRETTCWFPFLFKACYSLYPEGIPMVTVVPAPSLLSTLR